LATLSRPGDTHAERQQLKAIAVEMPPLLDGRGDDVCWAGAPAISLVAGDPSNADMPETTVQVVYNDQAACLLFRCKKPNPGQLKTGSPERDSLWLMDAVEFFLDLDSDQQSYLHLGVSPGGAWMAFYCPTAGNAQSIGRDFMRFVTAITNDEWIAEVALDFAKLPADLEPPGPLGMCFSAATVLPVALPRSSRSGKST
jgi:hypothetical protein